MAEICGKCGEQGDLQARSWSGQPICWDCDGRGEPITIELNGPVPPFKNSKVIALIRGRSRIITNRKYHDQMEALRWQCAGFRAPLENPDMEIQLYVTERRKDRDNLVSALLDVLVSSGVLLNDNIARCNGKLTILPAIVGEREGATIRLWPREES